MDIDTILKILICFMVILLLSRYTFEGFTNIDNKNIYFENNNDKYLLITFYNLNTNYKKMVIDELINNEEYMKNENKFQVPKEIFYKVPMFLIKESDKTTFLSNEKLPKFNLIDNSNDKYALTPIIENIKTIDNYVYNDNMLFYSKNGNNIFETNNKIYLKKLNNGMYSFENNGSNNNILNIKIE